MTTVYGLHEIELRPEVDPEEYEAWFAEEVAGQPVLPGWKAYLLRGERGRRTGKYLMVFEMDSIEDRDRFVSEEGEQSGELQRYLAEHPEIVSVWKRGLSFEAWSVSTDYEVVAG